MWRHYRRIIKPYGPIVLFATQPFATDIIFSARDLFKYDMVWVKARAADFVKARCQLLRNHELILIFSEGVIDSESHTDRKMPYYGEDIENEDRYSRSVIDDYLTGSNPEPRLHPMQKPISLLRFLISMYSRPGDTVLDSFMGSGSTGVTAIETNRNFVGIEKERVYFERAAERLKVAAL